VWITTGFGAKYAGPGGTNFKCKCDTCQYLTGNLTESKTAMNN
jgi:hypothetical protein